MAAEPTVLVERPARRRYFVRSPLEERLLGRRHLYIVGVALFAALVVGVVAQGLGALIQFFTNLAFFGQIGFGPASPADNALGWGVVVVPVVGGIIVGLMARYGSKAIRGHGIPEAMEQVLFNESRIPYRITWLKPLSAAISIGTGGPFGAEGPIIATGGAFGSLLGQLLPTSADERKTLLAAGAAAGMAATFGTPVSAVLLAVELLLFEYRPRSVVPVALAACAATAVRSSFVGLAPVFPMADVTAPTGAALAIYGLVGSILGVAAVLVTRLVYAVEDGFEKLPIHWMWWPALGGVVVGVVGYFAPATLGVGYTNIEHMLGGGWTTTAILTLGVFKLVSWSVSLGSGTSGGTLAPLLTIGGALGGALVAVTNHFFPQAALDPRMGVLVGMAALFAGASRAFLASVVFAFECTRHPISLLPLLAGSSVAYLVSCALMENSIMTEKLARRGSRISTEYQTDYLEGQLVRDHATRVVVTLDAGMSAESALDFLTEVSAEKLHTLPVVDGATVLGMVTSRALRVAARETDVRVGSLATEPVVSVTPGASLRDAADLMAARGAGRLIVVEPLEPGRVWGILSRGDLLRAHRARLLGARAEVRMAAPVTTDS